MPYKLFQKHIENYPFFSVKLVLMHAAAHGRIDVFNRYVKYAYIKPRSTTNFIYSLSTSTIYYQYHASKKWGNQMDTDYIKYLFIPARKNHLLELRSLLDFFEIQSYPDTVLGNALLSAIDHNHASIAIAHSIWRQYSLPMAEYHGNMQLTVQKTWKTFYIYCCIKPLRQQVNTTTLSLQLHP